MIEVSCCTEKLKVSVADLGKKIRCPSCNRIIQVTTAGNVPPDPAVSDFDAALDLLDGPNKSVMRYVLGGAADITIGKFLTNHIQLTGERVSRQHCRLVRISFAPPRWKIVDQFSANGIIINGARATEHELSDGDVIQIGDYNFRYTVLGWAAVSPTSAHGTTWSNEDVNLPIAPPEAIDLAPWSAPKSHPLTASYQRGTGPMNNGIAIARLIFGILLCIPICPIFAVVFSSIGLNRARKRNGAGFASSIVGLILGIIGITIFIPLFIAILIPSINRAKEIANRIACASNLRTINAALVTYANANGGAYPPSLNTLVNGGLLQPKDIICPDAPPGTTSNYILAASDSNLPGNTIVVYEPLTNHTDGINVLYADGRVIYLSGQQAQNALASLQNRPTFPAFAMHPPVITLPPPPMTIAPSYPPPSAPPNISPQPISTPNPPVAVMVPPNPPQNPFRQPFQPGQPQPGPGRHSFSHSWPDQDFSSDLPDGALQTEMIGGHGGGPYVRIDADNRLVIGFAVQLGSWSGHTTLGHVYPLYDQDTSKFPREAKINLAKDGHAVGGINVNMLDGADGMQIIFMRIKANGALDPNDFYMTNWIGDTEGNNVTKLAGNGQRVIGTFGRQGMNNDAIGLVVESPPASQP
jgi:prepilin-type processing-associated H-X9-DG protein